MVSLFLADLLAGQGCTVVGPAATPAEAEALATERAVDFAILDVSLVGGTSFRTAEILISRRLPFMFLTAYGVSGIREDLRTNPILAKPVEVEALQALLRAVGVV
jgi:CheY-like chemotaxis protein